MDRVIDRILLLVVSVVVSILAGFYWHYLGQHAFTILNLILILVLFIENRILRKEINSIRQTKQN